MLIYRVIYMLIMPITSFVRLRPTPTCRPLADWPSSVLVLAPMSSHSAAEQRGPRVSQIFPPLAPREIYASGGGLLVAPTNTPHLLGYLLAVWLSGNALASINVVALRQTRLVPGWVTVCGRVNYLGLKPAN